MKILISSDMEGIAGVTTTKQLFDGGFRYNLSCELFTQELNATIRACFDKGAKEVLVVDGHGSGLNAIPSMLDKRAKLIQGKPRKYFMMEGINKQIDYCLLIGYHGMSNKLCSAMGHTNNSSIMPQVKINGNEAGEILMNILLAKQFGVKTIFVSGTDKAIEETNKLSLGIHTLVTKESISTQSSILKSSSLVKEQIYDCVKKSLLDAKKIKLIKTKNKFEFKIKYPFTFQIQSLDSIPNVELLDDNTIMFTMNNYEEAYRLYRHINEFVANLKPY